MAFGHEEGREGTAGAAVEGPDASVVLPARPQTAIDLAAAKLAGTVRSRPGHVVVVGTSAAEAQTLFQSIEPQLGRFLRIVVDGREINPEAVVQALWEADGRTATSGGRPLAMMRVLAGEAALAGRPIVVTVTDADAASASQLERLRQMIESVPAAEEVVRIVLLGGPTLLDTLARPDARAVAMRVVSSVRVPSADAPVAATVPIPIAPTPPRSKAAVVTSVLAAGVLAAMWMRGGGEPAQSTPDVTAPREAVAEVGTPPALAPAPVIAEPAAASPPPAPNDPVAGPVPADPVPPPVPAEPPVVELAPAPRPQSPETRPAPPVSPRRGSLSLQVGAFSNAATADQVRRRLGDRFGTTSVSTTEREGRQYYRVRVTGFADEGARRAAAGRLRAAGFSPLPVRD